jgi:catechol 2,3-dioxygenase-like lactoylglutathione lyase family enzyme
MRFISPLIAVTEMERSKTFYKKHLGLNVEQDFGANVTLTGGIALQTLETWRGFIAERDVRFGNNAAELYFEEDDFDGFVRKLDGLQLVHPPYEHPWGQRVVRFYDPDRHIIEVGENMEAVVRRFHESGMTTSEVAARMDVPEEYVRKQMETVQPRKK